MAPRYLSNRSTLPSFFYRVLCWSDAAERQGGALGAVRRRLRDVVPPALRRPDGQGRRPGQGTRPLFSGTLWNSFSLQTFFFVQDYFCQRCQLNRRRGSGAAAAAAEDDDIDDYVDEDDDIVEDADDL